MRKIRLTESELIDLVKRIIKEQDDFDQLDDTPIEDEPSLSDFDDEDDIEDYGFDVDDDFEDDDDFQSKMRQQERMRNVRPSHYGIGGGSRWDNEMAREAEKPWSPIKPSDMPLEKYLKYKNKEK
jgi:hypothetical protein